jgi:hypothetical protein
VSSKICIRGRRISTTQENTERSTTTGGSCNRRLRNVSGILELPNCTVEDCEPEFPEIEKGVEIPLRQPSRETEFSAVLGNGLEIFSQAV